MIKNLPTAAAALLAAAVFATPASAALVIAGSTMAAAPLPGSIITPVDLGGATAPSQAQIVGFGYTVNFVGTPAHQGVVAGASGGQYAIPIADSAGTPLAGNYFSTGDTGRIEILFTNPQLGLSLLWGSIDGYNTLELRNRGSVVATVGGAAAAGAAGIPAKGFQGFGGSAYITLTGVTFNEVRFTSGSNSFEFGAVRASERGFGEPNPVPVPAALALFGAGLLGLGLVARKRQVAG